MAGLYFHIPFCRKACVYCDFHFVTSLQRADVLLRAMEAELRQASPGWPFAPFDTVYFGGGTPSFVAPEAVARLLAAARYEKGLAPNAEITLEANPDDLTPERLEAWQQMGVNRLSVGVQAFDASALAWMNRTHALEDIYKGLEAARRAGFTAFNLDLIFGWPGLTEPLWADQLSAALSLDPDHLSVYSLTVEPKTALARQTRLGAVALPDQDQYARQFFLAHETLESAGFIHYEISNYALPGKSSRHNQSYWQGAPYLGIGPSAHSYDGSARWWNAANNSRYLHGAEVGFEVQREREVISRLSRYHEYVMTGLRQATGIDPYLIEAEFVPDWRRQFAPLIDSFEREGLLTSPNPETVVLTPAGWMVADDLTSRFFLDRL